MKELNVGSKRDKLRWTPSSFDLTFYKGGRTVGRKEVLNVLGLTPVGFNTC
jgi:hypothetical protein